MLTLDLDGPIDERIAKYIADIKRSTHNYHGGAPVDVGGCSKYIIAMALGSDPVRECFNIYMCVNGLERGYLSVWRRDKSMNIVREKCDMPEWCKPFYEIAMIIRDELAKSA